MSISEIDKKHIWHPFTQMQTAQTPIPITHGKGSLLFDENNNSYIDAISSWWVNVHGHANEQIASKVHQQLLKLEHVLFAGFTHEPATKLCQTLKRYLPENQNKFFFSGDGSSAVEIALKMSIQYWKNKGINRQNMLALEGGYHGETFGAMSAGSRSIFSAHFNDYLFEVKHLPFPKDEDYCLVELENHLKSGEVACFIFEPMVQGAAGMRMFSADILDKMIGLCKKHEVLCIADEVMTGFFRTGTFFACNQLKNAPDFMCLSKSLSGGTLPISLTTCTNGIYDAFLGNDIGKAFLHGHSFTGNPVGCAAAIANIELLEKDSCQEKIQWIVDSHHNNKLRFEQSLNVLEVRQKGTILAIELNTQKKGYDNLLKEKLYHFYIERGVLLRPLGNVIYILPPYCITENELNTVYNCIEHSLQKLI